MPCQTNYANSTAINISAGSLPPGFCHTTWQSTLNTFSQSLSASLSGNTSTFTFSANEPDTLNRDRPWLKVNTGICAAEGWYFFNSVSQLWEAAKVPDAALPNTGVVAGSYSIASMTVDAKGRLTAASGVDINTVPWAAKAWVRFNGTTGVIARSHNVSGLVKNATGNYTVNLSVTLSGTQAVVAGSSGVSGFASKTASPFITATTVNSVSLLMPSDYLAGMAGDGDEYWFADNKDTANISICIFD